MTKKGRSGILDEVGGLHDVEIKKNGIFTLADHGNLADHGVEIKKNGSSKLAEHESVANQHRREANKASKHAKRSVHVVRFEQSVDVVKGVGAGG